MHADLGPHRKHFKLDHEPEPRIVPDGRTILRWIRERVRLASAEAMEMAVSLSMEKRCQLSAQRFTLFRVA